MHPRMARMVSKQIEGLADDGIEVAVVEAAVLFEAGWDSLVDEVWTTESPRDAVVDRLVRRNGFTKKEAVKRINSQMSPEERARRAQVVVDNSGDVTHLESTIKSLWDNRVKAKVGKV